jgi:DeoR family fructose operon transcriptional repressor
MLLILADNDGLMIPEERKRKIARIVKEREGASVTELADELSVSESTIRRDLKKMDQEDLVRRSHGGALPVKKLAGEASFDQRSVQNLEEKKSIADRALTEIREGEVVFFDSGTTVLEVAKRIPKDGSIISVTNSIELGFELGKEEGNLKITGGNQRNKSRSLVGPVTERFLSNHRFDLLLLGTNSIDPQIGLSTQNEQEARVKQLMVEKSERIVLLADGSKLEQRSYVKFADVADIDMFITDVRLTDEQRDEFRERDVDTIDGLL